MITIGHTEKKTRKIRHFPHTLKNISCFLLARLFIPILISGIEKRRSGRNTKRKKYVDDVQYNFSKDELKGLSKVSFM